VRAVPAREATPAVAREVTQTVVVDDNRDIERSELSYDGYVRNRWTGKADAFERSSASLCGYCTPRLVEAVGVRTGTRVLDIGCGTGTATVLAVGRGAVVTAVDAEPSMLERTAAMAPDAVVKHGVLPGLPFEDGTFDAVLGSFVLNQVGDPAAAIDELYRVLVPGGRIGVTLWPDTPTALHDLWERVLQASGAVDPADRPAPPPALPALQTGPGLVAGLSAAGFEQARYEVVEWTHRIAAEQLWSGPANGVTMVGAVLARQTPDVRRAAREAFDRISPEYLGDDGLLALPVTALIATGTRPGLPVPAEEGPAVTLRP